MKETSPKPKFYQPDPRDQEREEIIGSINRQEQNILRLLQKYKDLLPDASILQPKQSEPSKSRRTKHKNQDSLTARNRSATMNYDPQLFKRIKLPQISSSQKSKQTRRGKGLSLGKQQQSIESSYSKILLKQSRTIQAANLNQSNKPIKSTYLPIGIKSHQKDINSTKNQNIFNEIDSMQPHKAIIRKKQKIINKNDIMEPISHKRNDIMGEDDSDSDQDYETEIPIKFYEKQWQRVFEQQCKEQINFLYFSTTTEMKEWSQQIAQIFEKHDGELAKLHKRNIFLDHFDESYFLSDIYKGNK